MKAAEASTAAQKTRATTRQTGDKEVEKLRLFVGTFLDARSAESITNLKALNKDLSTRWGVKARFVPLSKLHLTWLFIGDVEKEKLDSVKADLKNAIGRWKEVSQNASFKIEYDAVEVWSSLKSPRVLVLESTQPCPQAGSLNIAITSALSKFCSKEEEPRSKRFRPHLTVCRFSPDARAKIKRSLDDFVRPDDLFPLVHQINEVSLIVSDLNAGADGYKPVMDIPLD